MSWESPIDLIHHYENTKIKEIENGVLAEIQEQIEVRVDKEKLMKALTYSQDSYNKGYAEGRDKSYQEYKEKLFNIYIELLKAFKDDSAVLKTIDIIFEEPTTEVNAECTRKFI